MTKTFELQKLILLILIKVLYLEANYDKYYLDDTNFCGKSKNSVPIGQQSHKSTVVISAVQSSNSYKPSLKCSLVVRAPPNHGIIVNKRMVNLRNETVFESTSSKRKSTPNPQPNDQLIISLNNRLKTFSGSDLEESLYSSDKNEVLVTFLTSSSKSSTFGKNFELIFTAFTSTDSTGQCIDPKDWFDCGDNRCVQKSLICDNIPNCISNEDEGDSVCGKWCSKNKELFWTLFIIGWSISTFFIILTMIVCLLYRRLCFIICF